MFLYQLPKILLQDKGISIYDKKISMGVLGEFLVLSQNFHSGTLTKILSILN
jgi:hypothetical protein